jgi:ATP-dependent DNA helicase PIF1
MEQHATSNQWFLEFLLAIENNVEETLEEDYIKLPSEICVPYTGTKSNIKDLIDKVFPMLGKNIRNSNYIRSWAILSTRNENVNVINMMLTERFLREQMVYHNTLDDPNNHYPPKFLNSLTPNGLLPYILKIRLIV